MVFPLNSRIKTACVRAVVMAVAAAGVGAGAASAGTLAYVKNGAAWVAAPDGSDAHEVGAGLSYPSLADSGTVYALAGPNQVDVLPPGAPEQSPITIVGIGADELNVSPDGAQLAWRDAQPGLGDIQSGVSTLRIASGLRTDKVGYAWPKWFSASQLTMAGPQGGMLYDPDANLLSNPLPDLFDPPDAYDTDVWEYDIDRGDDKGAALIDFTQPGPPGDPNAHTLVVFPVAGGAPATDTGHYCLLVNSYHQPIEASDLTWSPDGSALAWQQSDGIHIASIGPLDNQCADFGGQSQLVIPGGSEPAWGPSDNRSFPEPSPPPPGPMPNPGPNPTVLKLTAIKLPKSLKAIDAVKHGIRIRVTLPTTGTLSAKATISKRVASKDHLRNLVLASGTVQAQKASVVTIVLRVTAKDAAALKHAHGVRLSITLAFGQLSVTRALTLR